MKMNCDAANKMVRQLQSDISVLLGAEKESSTYTYGADEKERPAAPFYDFDSTSRKLGEYEAKVRKLKHAINVFNVSTVLPGLDITIDEALVKMAMLNQRKKTLQEMRSMQPLTRSQGYGKAAEYRVRNFEPKPVQDVYDQVSAELLEIQQALNRANLTEEIEVDI